MFPEMFPRTDTFTLMLGREASNKGLYLNWEILHLDSQTLMFIPSGVSEKAPNPHRLSERFFNFVTTVLKIKKLELVVPLIF
jgi:hypothetical protein